MSRVAPQSEAGDEEAHVTASPAMTEALTAESELEALAWIDLRSGVVFHALARDDGAYDALDLATIAAQQLCASPRADATAEQDERPREALVVSETAVHAFVVSRRLPDCAVVGVGPADANVGLLLASVRSVAEGLSE